MAEPDLPEGDASPSGRPPLARSAGGSHLGGNTTIAVETAPSEAEGARKIKMAYREERYEGPLPHPDHLQRIAEIYPDAPRIIFETYELQVRHRVEMERRVVESQIRLAERGQSIGALIGMTGVLGGIILVGLGHAGAGLAILSADLLALVGIFVLGRRAEAKERAEKRELQEKIARNAPVESLENTANGDE